MKIRVCALGVPMAYSVWNYYDLKRVRRKRFLANFDPYKHEDPEEGKKAKKLEDQLNKG